VVGVKASNQLHSERQSVRSCTASQRHARHAKQCPYAIEYRATSGIEIVGCLTGRAGCEQEIVSAHLVCKITPAISGERARRIVGLARQLPTLFDLRPQ